MNTNITIVSGGQNGTDEGALRGATRLGIATAGRPATETACKYMSCTDRDIENVDMSDLVVARLDSKRASGTRTRATIACACGFRLPKECNSPTHSPTHMRVSGSRADVIIVWDLDDDKVPILTELLRVAVDGAGYRRIMFSGPPECSSPGIAQFVEDLVVSAFGTANQ